MISSDISDLLILLFCRTSVLLQHIDQSRNFWKKKIRYIFCSMDFWISEVSYHVLCIVPLRTSQIFVLVDMLLLDKVKLSRKYTWLSSFLSFCALEFSCSCQTECGAPVFPSRSISCICYMYNLRCTETASHRRSSVSDTFWKWKHQKIFPERSGHVFVIIKNWIRISTVRNQTQVKKNQHHSSTLNSPEKHWTLEKFKLPTRKNIEEQFHLSSQPIILGLFTNLW